MTRDSDGTRSAETGTGSGPQQDCQARGEAIANTFPEKPHDS